MGLQVTDVQRSLAGFDYPGTAADLANHAEKHGADSKLVDALRGLEKDTFSGHSAVMEALGSQTSSAEKAD